MFNNSLSMLVLALACLVQFGVSHMHLEWPPTLKGENNPHTQGEPSPYLNYPYGCCGQSITEPCKGFLDLVETDEGRPVTTWAAGQKVNFTISGSSTTKVEGGTHYGGSCQAGFSTNGGKDFKVAASWNGNCPHRHGTVDPSTQTFDFTVPADLPNGERTIFAWTWLNREQEFNMGCAVVTTVSGSNETQTPDPGDEDGSGEEGEDDGEDEGDEDDEDEEDEEDDESSADPPPADFAQYTLEGCTCSCPYQTWSQACTCYDCASPSTKRYLVERKALQLHKRHLQNAEKLKAPARRTEVVAWNDRPNMLLSIDFPGALCQSKGDPYEVEFPNPGPDVFEGDGEYKLSTPTC